MVMLLFWGQIQKKIRDSRAIRASLSISSRVGTGKVVHKQWDFFSAMKRNKIVSFIGEGSLQLEVIILNKLSQSQKLPHLSYVTLQCIKGMFQEQEDESLDTDTFHQAQWPRVNPGKERTSLQEHFLSPLYFHALAQVHLQAPTKISEDVIFKRKKKRKKSNHLVIQYQIVIPENVHT